MQPRISVVIATRDRADALGASLRKLESLPDRPRVIVVDNGSGDGTGDRVRHDHPEVRLIALEENLGAAARNLGVEAADTAYVAFSDDDSWWSPGSLGCAADRFDAHPKLALIAAQVLVGPDEVLDPTCAEMARSPLPRCDDLPGPPVLGFLACGAVARRSSFLEVGGFEARFGVGGEEQLLAIDLASAGWGLAYCDDIVAHHHPASSAPRPGRRRRQCRNDLWSLWLRRPLGSALRMTVRAVARTAFDPVALAAFGDAMRGLPWVVRSRRPVPAEVEVWLRRLGHY
jgi:GT2 family glycosyltransferase